MITLKSNNLQSYLEALPSKILLIFASPTCPACKIVVPQVEKQGGDQMEILYIDGVKWEDIADEYNIEWYPTLILLKEGKEIKSINKITPKHIKKKLKKQKKYRIL